MTFYKLVCPGMFEDLIEAENAAEAIRTSRDVGSGLPSFEVWQGNQLIAVIEDELRRPLIRVPKSTRNAGSRHAKS